MGVLQFSNGLSVQTFQAPPAGFDLDKASAANVLSTAFRAARSRLARFSGACAQSLRTSA